MSHSKRNTSRSIFTSHERDLAKAAWSSNSARLNRDSFLPFGSCDLCLEVSREPVSCSHGDIFCRECAISNLFAQKKEIKRQTRAREKAQQDLEEAEARQDDEARERALKDFEAVQAGLNVTTSTREGTASSSSATTTSKADDRADSKSANLKRKAVLDADEVEKIAQEDRAKARKTIQEEISSKEKLPSFWAPSQTPGVDSATRAAALQATAAKDKPICPASSDESPHYYSLKALQPVNFTTETDSDTGNAKRICPSCKKLLGNSSRPVMAQKCGHVFCRSCVLKLHPPAKPGDESADQVSACFVCDTELKAEKSRDDPKRTKAEFPGMIELRSEGTGFSARGPSKVKKAGTAFQC